MNFVFSAESNKRSFLSQARVQILWSIFTNLLLQHSKLIGFSEKTFLPGSCNHCENWYLGDLTKPSKDQKTYLKLGTAWIADARNTSSWKLLMLIKNTHWFLPKVFAVCSLFFCVLYFFWAWNVMCKFVRENCSVYTEQLCLFSYYKEKWKSHCFM